MKKSGKAARLPLVVIIIVLLLAGALPAPGRSLAVPLDHLISAPTVRSAEVVLSSGQLPQVALPSVSSPAIAGAQPIAAFASGVIEAPVPFSHVGIRYANVLPSGSTITWEVRGSRDGQIWTTWHAMEEEDDLRLSTTSDIPLKLFGLNEDGRPELFRFAELRATLEAAGLVGPAMAPRVSIAFIDPSAGPTTAEAVRASGMVGIAVNTTGIARPPVISRTAWGSPHGQGSAWTPEYQTVTHALIHHTVTANQAVDWAAEVRAIWYYHAVTLGWGDIGYNFLVDPNGYIYEGRAGGDDVVGGHALQYNYGSLGLAVLGTYSSVYPSNAAQNSAVDLLAWKAEQRGINPLKMDAYLADKFLPTIAGHRDAITTSCPGNFAQAIIPALRSATWNRLTSQGVAAQIESATFEPTTVPSGNLLKVTVVVRNTGTSTIQTQGPSPGFVYNERDQYLTFEPERFGRLRVGLDLDGRTQSPDHPYRWGLGGDLPPGGTATVVGFVRLTDLKTANYWVGLVNEGVAWMADGVARTSVSVVSSDNTPPASSVVPLPRFVNASTLLVKWSGTDETGGSGIAYYDVEYRDGSSGAWQPWIQRATETQATFAGAPGHTYYFRSWAVDNTGNDERSRASKLNGDAVTTIDTTPPVIGVSVPPSTPKTWLVISWSAADSLSGIANYDVAYSLDGSNWTPWLTGATNPSALFSAGLSGQRYHFRVIARDNAGNTAQAIGGPVQFGYDSSGLRKTHMPLIGGSAK